MYENLEPVLQSLLERRLGGNELQRIRRSSKFDIAMQHPDTGLVRRREITISILRLSLT